MFDKQVKLGKSFRHSNEFLHSTVGLLQWHSDPSEHYVRHRLLMTFKNGCVRVLSFFLLDSRLKKIPSFQYLLK